MKAFVGDFLQRCLARFGPRGLTIVDSCESESTNLYNSYVKPSDFKRNAFMYTVLGMASEQAYPFAAFRLAYLSEQLGKARDRGLDEAMLFIQYAATNYPGVFAFADTLYEYRTTWRDTATRLASMLAKGEARYPFLDLLTAVEDLARAANATQLEDAVKRAEFAEAKLKRCSHFAGDRDWLSGYVKAQRHYLDRSRLANRADSTHMCLTPVQAWLAYRARNRDRQHVGAGRPGASTMHIRGLEPPAT